MAMLTVGLHILLYCFISIYSVSAKGACSDIDYETFDDPRWQIDPLNCNMFYGCDRTDRADFITVYHHYHYSCGLKYWSQEMLNCVDDIHKSSCLSHDKKNFGVDVKEDVDPDCEYESVPGHPGLYIHSGMTGKVKECPNSKKEKMVFDTKKCHCVAPHRVFLTNENGNEVPDWLASIQEKDAAAIDSLVKDELKDEDGGKDGAGSSKNGDPGGHANRKDKTHNKMAGVAGKGTLIGDHGGPLQAKGDTPGESGGNEDEPQNDDNGVSLHGGQHKADSKKKKDCKDKGILLCYPFDDDLDSHSMNWVKTAMVHEENGQLVESYENLNIVTDEVPGKVLEMTGSAGLMIPFLINWFKGWDLDQFSVYMWFKLDEASEPGDYSLVSNAGLMKNITEDEDIRLPSFYIDFTVEDGVAYVYAGLETAISLRTTTDRIMIEPIDEWHPVALVYNGAELQLYCDKQLVSSTPALGGIVNKDSPAIVGVRGWGDDRRFFRGLIDELRIYTKALSADDMQALP